MPTAVYGPLKAGFVRVHTPRSLRAAFGAKDTEPTNDSCLIPGPGCSAYYRVERGQYLALKSSFGVGGSVIVEFGKKAPFWYLADSKVIRPAVA